MLTATAAIPRRGVFTPGSFVLLALLAGCKDNPPPVTPPAPEPYPVPNPGDTRPRGLNGPTAVSGDCLYVGSRVGRRPGTGADFGTPALPPDILSNTNF